MSECVCVCACTLWVLGVSVRVHVHVHVQVFVSKSDLLVEAGIGGRGGGELQKKEAVIVVWELAEQYLSALQLCLQVCVHPRNACIDVHLGRTTHTHKNTQKCAP